MKNKTLKPSQEFQALAQEYLRLRAKENEILQQKNLNEVTRRQKLKGLHLQKNISTAI